MSNQRLPLSTAALVAGADPGAVSMWVQRGKINVGAPTRQGRSTMRLVGQDEGLLIATMVALQSSCRPLSDVAALAKGVLQAVRERCAGPKPPECICFVVPQGGPPTLALSFAELGELHGKMAAAGIVAWSVVDIKGLHAGFQERWAAAVEAASGVRVTDNGTVVLDATPAPAETPASIPGAKVRA